MRKIFILAAWLIWVVSPVYPFTLSNFDTPESFAVDPEDGSYYVSNINGQPAEKDGNGYISKINAGGSLVIQRFIGGKKGEMVLHAPKGIVIVGKNLFAADIDSVKVFDKETGKLMRNIDFSKFGAKFLNDITDDGRGVFYVSDTMTNQIFKFDSRDKYTVTVFKEGKELGGPNGVRVNPKSKNLMVVTWGSGQILEIDRQGGIHVLKRGLSGLDGIDYDNEGNLYVSSFEKGEIYKIAYWGRGAITTFLNGLVTPADISCDRNKNEILIPSFKGNTVTTQPLRKKA